MGVYMSAYDIFKERCDYQFVDLDFDTNNAVYVLCDIIDYILSNEPLIDFGVEINDDNISLCMRFNDGSGSLIIRDFIDIDALFQYADSLSINYHDDEMYLRIIVNR